MKDPRVERLVLRHLEGRPLNRGELVSRTAATDHQVQAVLDELIGTSHVVRRPQDIGPADYELTPLGVERLAQVGRITASPVPVAKRRPPLSRPKAARRPAQAPTRPVPHAPRFAAEPKPADRELIVNLAKSLGIGIVFAGVIILSGASLILLLAALVVTAVNMFTSYRSWADKRGTK